MIPYKTRELSTSEVRVLLLASVGGALEFYDFVIFVFFATIIGKLFFAPSLPDWVRQARLLESLLQVTWQGPLAAS